MYEEEDYLQAGPGGMGAPEEDNENEEIPNEIWQEACWIVISAYFEEKGRFSDLYFLGWLYNGKLCNLPENRKMFSINI